VSKISLIINGSRKLKSETKEVIQRLHNLADFEVEELPSEFSGHSIELARNASKGSNVVIAVGGDGTANEVVNGILAANSDCSFGIIPNGTGNDFLYSTGGFDPDSFIQSVKERRSRKVDVGVVKYEASKKYFLNVADIGFGATVIEKMNSQRKNGFGGGASYGVAILRTFLTNKKRKIDLRIDGKDFSSKALMITFCNGSTFGNGLVIHPGAKIDDGRLSMTVIGDVTLFEYLRNLKNLKRGLRIDHKEVHYFDAYKIEIIDIPQGVSLEGDGELFEDGFKEISILPARINLLN
jgi:YegS/Rv2252/BmrU family lipid kinase